MRAPASFLFLILLTSKKIIELEKNFLKIIITIITIITNIKKTKNQKSKKKKIKIIKKK